MLAKVDDKKFAQKNRLCKFRDFAQIALFWPLGRVRTLKGPDTRSKCVVTICLTPAGHSGAVGTKSGPLGPYKDLLGPQKGLSGPKRTL